VPAVLLVMAPLFVRWRHVPNPAVAMTYAAGFTDVIGFGYAIHPPQGGYLALDIHHLSVLYVMLAVALLAAATLLRRLHTTRGRAAGMVFMAGLLLLWFALFLVYARQDHAFLKFLSAPDWRFNAYQPFGLLALLYVIWRIIAARGGWPFVYLASGVLVVLALGLYLPVYACFPAVIAAALAPVALSELSQKSRKNPGLSAPWPEA
jgi:hypothetical protein